MFENELAENDDLLGELQRTKAELEVTKDELADANEKLRGVGLTLRGRQYSLVADSNYPNGRRPSRLSTSLQTIHGMLDKMEDMENRVASVKFNLPSPGFKLLPIPDKKNIINNDESLYKFQLRQKVSSPREPYIHRSLSRESVNSHRSNISSHHQTQTPTRESFTCPTTPSFDTLRFQTIFASEDHIHSSTRSTPTRSQHPESYVAMSPQQSNGSCGSRRSYESPRSPRSRSPVQLQPNYSLGSMAVDSPIRPSFINPWKQGNNKNTSSIGSTYLNTASQQKNAGRA